MEEGHAGAYPRDAFSPLLCASSLTANAPGSPTLKLSTGTSKQRLIPEPSPPDWCRSTASEWRKAATSMPAAC